VAAGEQPAARPRYGNWQKPPSAGIAGLPFGQTIGVLGALVVVVIVMQTSGPLIGAGALAIVGAAVWALRTRDRDGVNMIDRTRRRAGWWRTKRLGAQLYRSGPLSKVVPWGTCQLPGLLAATRLHEFADSYGRPFAVVHMPTVNMCSVVLSTEPDGDALVDDDQVDQQVARWGHWLATLADQPALRGASVTVETAPDTGSRLRQEVMQNLDPAAPAFAGEVLDEILTTYPVGGSSIHCYVALTFVLATSSGARRSLEETVRDLASRLPSLTQRLEATGAGAVRPASAAELCQLVRTAYDPAAAALLDEAAARGEVVEMDWSDVGPTAHEAGWTSYRHDSGLSTTWLMSQAPRGAVTSRVLSGLLAPHPDIARKRVTLLYRPIDPARAPEIVDADLRAASAGRGAGPTVSATARRSLAAAERTAEEEAAGAGLLEFGMLVTATVMSNREHADARAAIDSLAGASRIRVRPVYGSQDSAFAAALPLGLNLPRFQRTAVRGGGVR